MPEGCVAGQVLACIPSPRIYWAERILAGLGLGPFAGALFPCPFLPKCPMSPLPLEA